MDADTDMATWSLSFRPITAQIMWLTETDLSANQCSLVNCPEQQNYNQENLIMLWALLQWWCSHL